MHKSLSLLLLLAPFIQGYSQFPFFGGKEEKTITSIDSLIAATDTTTIDSLSIDTIVHDTMPITPGVLSVQKDPRWDALISKYKSINERDCPNIVKGYRIQVFSSSGTGSSQRAREARTKFLTFYPDIHAYNDYDSPNFRVRVGNFRTKLEAERVKLIISQDFPSAFIVPDFIETEITERCQAVVSE